MNNQIQSQAAKVWGIIKDPATGNAYSQVISTTWLILKETGYLLWLIVCLTLVFGDWIWRTGYRTGWSTREWINNFEKPSSERTPQDTAQGLLEASKSALTSAIATAKTQLGIEDKFEPFPAQAAIAATETPASPPSPTPTPTPAPVFTPSTPPTPKTEELDSE